VGFVAATVVLPVGAIGIALIYFDQRVRQEAFDLQVLMGPESLVTETAATESYGGL